MATRSTIWAKQEDGRFKGVYCHFDGYLSGVGQNLLNHYNTFEKVNELISNGSISALYKQIKPTIENYSFENREDDVCLFYHRDRGDDLEIYEINNFDDFEKYHEEYAYFFIDGKWQVVCYGQSCVELTQELIDDDE